MSKYRFSVSTVVPAPLITISQFPSSIPFEFCTRGIILFVASNVPLVTDAAASEEIYGSD